MNLWSIKETFQISHSCPFCNDCLRHLHSFQSHFLFFSYSIIFVLAYPRPCALFSHFSALTGNGFACHVRLVTDCVMDGILVRALLCLRHTVGQKHPRHLPLYLSRTAPCSRHPVLLRIFSYRSSFSKQPCFGSSSICWLFTLVWHYLSSRCVSVCCRQSIIVLYIAL